MKDLELVIQDVTKSYQKGQKIGIDSFSAIFTPGVYGILGPNGAGKSTLMNLITNQLHPDKGSITYNQKPIGELGRLYRSILGYMPQQQGLYDDFTGRRFLWYIASLKGLDVQKTKGQVDYLLEIVNLSKYANKRLRTYSGGMKQRILIAQALLNDPEVLILDEPTAGLDPKERIRLRNFISSIASNKIVLIATHVVSDIEYIAKEILLMRDGKKIVMNTPHAIISEMEGQVFETHLSAESLSCFQKKYKVSNVSSSAQGLLVRFISRRSQLPNDCVAVPVKPNLEDVYLCYFE